MTPILTLTPRTRLADRDLHVLHAFDRAAPLHLRALLAALRRSGPHDREAAEELTAWTERTGVVVRRHHAVVRTTLGPLLVESDPLAANLLGALGAGHRLVAEALDAVVAALHAWVRVAGPGGGEASEHAHRRSIAAVERAVVAMDEQVRREQVTFEPAVMERPPVCLLRLIAPLGLLSQTAEKLTLPFAFALAVLRLREAAALFGTFDLLAGPCAGLSPGTAPPPEAEAPSPAPSQPCDAK